MPVAGFSGLPGTSGFTAAGISGLASVLPFGMHGSNGRRAAEFAIEVGRCPRFVGSGISGLACGLRAGVFGERVRFLTALGNGRGCGLRAFLGRTVHRHYGRLAWRRQLQACPGSASGFVAAGGVPACSSPGRLPVG